MRTGCRRKTAKIAEEYGYRTSVSQDMGESCAIGSVDRDDGRDLWDVVLEVALDAFTEGHRSARAADAGAVEADFDRAVVRDFDEFEVAAVGLDGGTDGIEHASDALVEASGEGRGVGGVGSHVGR